MRESLAILQEFEIIIWEHKNNVQGREVTAALFKVHAAPDSLLMLDALSTIICQRNPYVHYICRSLATFPMVPRHQNRTIPVRIPVLAIVLAATKTGTALPAAFAGNRLSGEVSDLACQFEGER